MRVLIINVVCGIRSTGRICTDLATELEKQGHNVKIAYGRESVLDQYQKYAVRIGNHITEKLNALSCRFFDNDGFSAKIQTKQFLQWADEFDPEMLWLHNLHGYYINIEMLFNWIKSRPRMEVKWTLHDCWAFTGHCSHFKYANCNKWKTECHSCAQKMSYPKSVLLDRSKQNYTRKKKAFCGITTMKIIAVSHWLEKLVNESYLHEYPIEVSYNKINKDVFKPTPSDFRERHGIVDKIVVLGVASNWNNRKGLNVFRFLSEQLPDIFTIVLVGLEHKQTKVFKHKENIICIPKTNNTLELAQIYSMADIFVNPSVEETFGLTTLESICCGTQVIVYKDTACEEIANIHGGIVVDRDQQNILNMLEELYLE